MNLGLIIKSMINRRVSSFDLCGLYKIYSAIKITVKKSRHRNCLFYIEIVFKIVSLQKIWQKSHVIFSTMCLKMLLRKHEMLPELVRIRAIIVICEYKKYIKNILKSD